MLALGLGANPRRMQNKFSRVSESGSQKKGRIVQKLQLKGA